MPINLPVLDYREYQKPLIRYMRGGLNTSMSPKERAECRKRKKAVWVAHRRSGKDVTCWQYMIEAAMEDVGTYFYCLPEFSHARRVIWEGMLNDGLRFLDLVPAAIVKSKHESLMKIELINGSIIQLVGSDQYDRLVGTNPKGIVFSEYSLTHPMAYQILRAILAANGGWVIFNGTPRGKNHFHEMLEQAKTEKDWFWSVDTVKTTGVLSDEVLAKEKHEMDIDIFNQEYLCSFDAASKGSYYSEQIMLLRDQKRICKVPYDPKLLVYTAFDPGDAVTAMVFFQIYGKELRVIDAQEFYSPSVEGIYTFITQKPYKYAKHYLPFDATVSQMATGMSIMAQLQKLGLQNVVDLPQQRSKMDGIMQVKSAFAGFWIDNALEKIVLEPLSNYAPKWNEQRNTYSTEPDHNWASHMCIVAGTMITMTDGTMKPIETINIGDSVLTPCGAANVSFSGPTKSVLDTIKITFSNGSLIECSPEHRFFTDKGLVRSDALRYDDVIWTQQSIPKRLSSTELFTNYREDITSLLQAPGKNTAISIEQYGHSTMVKFPSNTTFIIKIITTSTILSRIYSVLKQAHITHIMQRIVNGTKAGRILKSFFLKQSQPQERGMQVQQDLSGIQSMQKNPSNEENGYHENAMNVGENTKLLGLRDQNFVTSIVKCERVQRESGNEILLYDLTVDSHHCYLANGILVSNSDAIRYMVLAYLQSSPIKRAPHVRKSIYSGLTLSEV